MGFWSNVGTALGAVGGALAGGNIAGGMAIGGGLGGVVDSALIEEPEDLKDPMVQAKKEFLKQPYQAQEQAPLLRETMTSATPGALPGVPTQFRFSGTPGEVDPRRKAIEQLMKENY